MIHKFISAAVVMSIATSLSAQTLENTAYERIETLEKLIKKAKRKRINTLKEETVIRSSEIFLEYAAWDEKNVDTNTKYFAHVHKFKNEAAKYAADLPEWERQEIVTMLDSSIAELKAVMDGKIRRLDTPKVDWAKVSVEGDELVYKGKPVFLSDWTWKPNTEKYKEYHGDQDGYYMSAMNLMNENGDVTPRVLDELKAKEDGSIGFIFIGHSAVPNWAKQLDPKITEGPGIKYTAYDINNPLAKKMHSDLFAKTVPLMAGKKYTQLGYMLCNEPHWNTINKDWAAGPISEYAYRDFIKYLETTHKDIATLNGIWGSAYGSFDDIDIPRIREANEQGSPLYFDFMRYNMHRVTEWFKFMDAEIKKHDADAKTHIKIMPNLWSDGKRDSGIDMEAITRNTDIIGNDASTCGPWMWGKPHKWEANYSYDWKEITMAYDFFKSISPEKIMYNTEGHMLSTGKYRDLYQKPEYVRNNYWLAHIHGLTAMQTWYWARKEDGSCRSHEDANGYAGSNNHQPRVVNEVHTTMLDLNSVSDYIMDFQRQRKPIRIFYTEASAINSQQYIEDIFDTYESMFFDGTPIGFATKGIIEHNDNKDWEVVAISKTPLMFESDVQALQAYLNQGGTVVIDSESMLNNEYGLPLKTKLTAGKGKIVRANSLADLKTKSFENITEYPSIEIVDNNGLAQKGCTWRVIEGKKGSHILNIVNLSKNATKITVKHKGSDIKVKSMENVLTGESVANDFELPVYGMYLLELKDKDLK